MIPVEPMTDTQRAADFSPRGATILRAAGFSLRGVPIVRAAGFSPRGATTLRAAGFSLCGVPIVRAAGFSPRAMTTTCDAPTVVPSPHRLAPARHVESTLPSATRGFTLIELLVVIAIMAVLAAAVMVASTTLINRAKTSNTRAVLTIVRQAVDEFAREQKNNPTIAQATGYVNRYGRFPPDELEVFSTPNPLAAQLPGWPAGSLAPGGATVEPAPGSGYPPMRFYTHARPPPEAATEHRDLAAMILAIETLGDASAATLASLPERSRVSGPVGAATGGSSAPSPLVFLDRDGNGTFDPPGDLEIRYIVDDWGVPISYFAQRDWIRGQGTATQSTNHDDWNEASTVFIRNNDGQPVIMSYGPNGKDQLTEEAMGTNGTASLVWDFEGEGDDRITNPLNADNVYADPAIKEKLAEGLEENP